MKYNFSTDQAQRLLDLINDDINHVKKISRGIKNTTVFDADLALNKSIRDELTKDSR